MFTHKLLNKKLKKVELIMKRFDNIFEKLNQNPFKFWDLLPYYGNDFTPSIKRIMKEPEYSKLFKELTTEEIIEVSKIFLSTINNIKSKIMKSKIRMKTLISLTESEICTASSIAKEINTYPKNVSIYLEEFTKKKWVMHSPDTEDKRKQLFSLLPLGYSFYQIAGKGGWFDIIKKEPILFEKTYFKIDYGMGLSGETCRDGGIFSNTLKKEFFPDMQILLKNIRRAAKRLIESLHLDCEIPEIDPIGLFNDHFEIKSINDGDLAIILASINYLDDVHIEHRGNTYYPHVIGIKKITADTYFNPIDGIWQPYNDEGYLTEEDCKREKQKILTTFMKKNNIRKM